MLSLRIEDTVQKIIRNKPVKFLSFDLSDLLEVIKEKTKASFWDIHIDDYNGNPEVINKTILPEIAGKKICINGNGLLEISNCVTQIFDGLFLGKLKEEEEEYWIRIAVIDGRFWIVQCEDAKILKLYKEVFHQVKEIDEDPLEFIY